MAFRIKIQSFSDIITNSSSELFVVNRNEYCSNEQVQAIDSNWLDSFSVVESDLLCELLGLNAADFNCRGYEAWDDVWKEYINQNKDDIIKKLYDLGIVEVSDHNYSLEGYEEECNLARNAAVYSESRR